LLCLYATTSSTGCSSTNEAVSLQSREASSNFDRMQKGGWVYILTNRHHTVLYTGVTSDLIGRMLDHQQKTFPFSFTARYNVTKLIYFKLYDSIEEAITEEKRIKGGNRAAKITLANSLNPSWRNLWIEEVSKW